MTFDALVARIDAGKLGRVTSVVVRRGGAVVHESYHDEDGEEALRDTRSVTKTVTAFLVGIACWLRLFPAEGGDVAAVAMAGNGGNLVAIMPELDAVAVVTSTDFSTRGMHERTERLLVEEIIPALRAPGPPGSGRPPADPAHP